MGETKPLIPTVDAIVVALCADYERRKAAIKSHDCSFGAEMEYKYVNYKMLAAAQEIAGIAEAEIYIKEIGARTGYTNSLITDYSETTYKNRKKEVKSAIARKLRLVD